MNVQRKQKGFTIIEVVLVLAIAGLIFLMVFIALPALQRSQRDTQRKNDLSRALTAVTDYTSNNRGQLPAFNAAFIAGYLTQGTSTFVDPSGSGPSGTTGYNNTTPNPTYNFKAVSGGAALSGSFDNSNATSENQNVIYDAVGYSCGTGGAFTAASARTVALAMYLEGGGIACQNN